MFDKNKDYTRTDIQKLVGGELQTYLPQKNKRILAGCFNQELNPDCPYEVQAGSKPQVKAKAELLLSQSDNVFPVFIKPTMKSKVYRYAGQFKCIGGSNEPEILKVAEEKSERYGCLTYVLSLQQVCIEK
ncbi:hypothetical protein E5N05_16730 [Photobacterium sp. CAIM 1938]|uniref:hypothetical protein n=2 Tax=Photobacterium lucens TaxID=2562949 RepID=UPI0013696D58|nr:hypothetical protein [Photobacterium lucens]MBP2699583.1 hypothetical protein [Vibrio parahaemolyticus]MZG82191.1 hypothetical protein [Photobacterium lucens]